MLTLLIFIFGAVVGSFLNVVALRYGVQSISGRSKCFSCGKKLSWYELIPILSFVFQGGRCRGCKARISIQYPAIEILTGLIFLTLYLKFDFTTYLAYRQVGYLLLATVFSIYIVILIYDLRHKIIPDQLVYTAIFLSLGFGIYRFVWDLPALLSGGGGFGIWDFVAAGIIFLFFALIWLFSGGRAMGFGDAKLGLSVGLLLGATQGFSAIILAFWLGAGITLLYMGLSRIFGLFKGAKKLTMKSEIPFAPFIILGAWLSLIYDLNLLNITI